MPPAARALRAHRGGGEAQQLRVARDEDELVVVGRLGRADDLVAGLERDDLEVGLVRVASPATTRLTTPCAVPSAIGVSSSSETSASTRSVLVGDARGSRASTTPAASCTESAAPTGRSTGVNRMSAARGRDGAELAAGRGRRPSRGSRRACCAGPARRAASAPSGEVDAHRAPGRRQHDRQSARRRSAGRAPARRGVRPRRCGGLRVRSAACAAACRSARRPRRARRATCARMQRLARRAASRARRSRPAACRARPRARCARTW